MTTPPPPLDLARLEALAAAATPGPWRPESEPPPVGNFWFDSIQTEHVPIESRGTNFALGMAVAATAIRADAEFVCAARVAVPALVARVRELEAALAPFVREAAKWSPRQEDETAIGDEDLCDLTLGDLRAAARATTGGGA